MSKIDTLLSKAMSTSSEEEAIACLRMARKHGSSVGGSFESKQPKPNVEVANVMAEASKRITVLTNMYQGEVALRLATQQHLQKTTANLHLEIAKPKLTVAGAIVLMIIGYIIAVFIMAL